MNLYKMTIYQLCEHFCRGVNMYDKWLYYPMLAFVTEWKRKVLSEKTIKMVVDEWVDRRHLD